MIFGATLVGIQSHVVSIASRSQGGLPHFSIRGLSPASEREARVRVTTALARFGHELAPRTELMVEGASSVDGIGLDLPLALAALTQGTSTTDFGAIGELSLAGDVRAVRGVLPRIEALRGAVKVVLVAPENAAEATLVPGVRVLAVRTLADAVRVLRGEPADDLRASARARPAPGPAPDMRDVHVDPQARRALEVAAAGRHNLLLIGRPGAGKTMLARRLPSLLPAMTDAECLDLTRVHSAAGLNVGGGLIVNRPFRAPHHSTTAPGLVGGGGPTPRPGEVSLAHHGVLFLDELPEFSRATLESLSEVLATREAVLVRASGTVRLPANTLVVGTRLPCPCGYAGSPRCRCSTADISRYCSRIPGRLLDLFDLRVTIRGTDVASLDGTEAPEASASIAARVAAAAVFNPTSASPLEQDARPGARLLRVARTIASLAGSAEVLPPHLLEAEGLAAGLTTTC